MNSRRVLDDAGSGLFATDLGPVAVRSVLSEEAFHRMISLERKRTERSHKPFLLMLLDMGDELSANNGGGSLGKTLSVLALATRETDVVGWYTNGVVVGALFTEIDLEEKKHILNTVQERVRHTLEDNLDREHIDQISISFHWFPEEWQKVTSRRPNAPVLYPDLERRDQARKLFCGLKRAMDICGSLVALVLASPIFLLIALTVKLTSKGPVFFKQKRVGQYGVPFPLLKFRSMNVNNNCSLHKDVLQLIAGVAEKKPCNGNGQSIYKLTKDPRITPVGAFLRRTSMDELPQFINVLKGEMSLVGPRPPIDYEVDKYDLWHRRRVMEAKPGITGLWQVNGRNRLGFNEMVRLDLMYARSWSPWLDLKILLRTPRAVVAGAR